MRGARAVVVVVAVVLFAACGDARSNNAAAEVDGTEVSRAVYEDLLQHLTATSDTGVEADPTTGTVDGDTGRQLLAFMVLATASTEFLAGSGESVTDADRQAFLDTVPDDDPLREFPPNLLDLVVNQQAGAAARGRIQAPDVADLERRYRQSPAGTGVMCVRHILVESEAAADAVLEDLADGADFAELAGEVSIEPAAAETGGALEGGDGSACIPLAQAQTAFDPLFVAGAAGAVPGSPTGPVESSFGWHVIEARPWDEVEESVVALYDQAAGDLGFAVYLATADIDVDPRYGRWDPLVQTIVAL